MVLIAQPQQSTWTQDPSWTSEQLRSTRFSSRVPGVLQSNPSWQSESLINPSQLLTLCQVFNIFKYFNNGCVFKTSIIITFPFPESLCSLNLAKELLLFVAAFVPLKRCSLLWRRHHCRWMSANVDLYLAHTVINPVRQRKSVFLVIFEEPYILQHLNAIYIYMYKCFYFIFGYTSLRFQLIPKVNPWLLKTTLRIKMNNIEHIIKTFS